MWSSPKMATTTITLLLLFFFFFFFLSSPLISSSSSSIPGLDSYLTQQSHSDPQASKDPFISLSSHLKKSLFSSSSASSHSLSSLTSSLLSLQISHSIHIKLIGSFSSNSQTLLSSFISSTLFSDNFNVIASNPHHLSIKHTLHFDISSSQSYLATQISNAIKAEIEISPSTLHSSLQPVHFSVVDQIIKQDLEKEKPIQGIYLYLLNLNPQSKSYAYDYEFGDGFSSAAFGKCLGSVWVGKERYLWIDLAAGPVDYGPGLSGDGLLPRGEFHPLAALHGKPKSQIGLLADLASLVWSAYQVLLAPSLRVSVPFENSLIVQFIHVHGSEKNDLDWSLIEKTFIDDGGLLLGDQSLRFKSYDLSYLDCSFCSYVIASSKKFYTSRFLFDNYTMIVSEYLDSKRLHQILYDSNDELRKAAGVPEEDLAMVLPVYVFDLDDNEQLLLDRFHQSVAFKDMVIAVRTKRTQTASDYSCSGRHMITQTRKLERPIVGSILQSLWGVSPTHLSWSPRHNSTLVDYTWSIGNTPFGPFSESSSLSFVQKDAARRNVLLTSLNYSITSGIDVLESISGLGGDDRLFKRGQRVEFVQRWTLFKYKLDKVVSAMSHLDFEMALYFLRSSDHDIFAIHDLVYHASQNLEASLVCFEDEPFPWTDVSRSAFCCFAFVFIYVKRDKIFGSKRKQF